MGLFCLLLVGLVNPNDIVVYHDTNGRDLAGPYDSAINLSVLVILGLTMLASCACAYKDVQEAQIAAPRWVQLVKRLVYSLVWIVWAILRLIYYLLVGLLSVPVRRRRPDPGAADGPPSPAPKKASAFQSSVAFNREHQGDPPVVTGSRLADILWDAVFRRRNQRPTVSHRFDDDEVLVRPDDGQSWLRDKFAIQRRVFLLERQLQTEATLDPRSAMILRLERQLSVAIDAAVEYYERERDDWFDQLYDSEAENELLLADLKVASDKLAQERDVLLDVSDAVDFSRVKLEVEIRRIGQPEEWKRRFLDEQVCLAPPHARYPPPYAWQHPTPRTPSLMTATDCKRR